MGGLSLELSFKDDASYFSQKSEGYSEPRGERRSSRKWNVEKRFILLRDPFYSVHIIALRRIHTKLQFANF